MSTSDFMDGLEKALGSQVGSLRRLRRLDEYEAWGIVRAGASVNLADSRGSSEESYWQAAVAICDRHLGDTSDPRWKS